MPPLLKYSPSHLLEDQTLNEPHDAIRLVIFDWAGTTVDFGSTAPAAAFAGVFAANGIEVTDQEARTPMGLSKREHLIAMLRMPSIAERWIAAHGRPWNESDVDAMYEAFIPVQLDAIGEHAGLVPGLLDVVSWLRARGIKVGGTTGYFRAASEAVLQHAIKNGYQPDVNVCADDVSHGRPAPWMIYRVMEQLNIFPPSSVVKVGDTIADIKAGLAAGSWSIGVCDSSSVLGMTQAEYESLSPQDQRAGIDRAAKVFLDAGAHATIGSISELPTLIESIEQSSPTIPRTLPNQVASLDDLS